MSVLVEPFEFRSLAEHFADEKASAGGDKFSEFAKDEEEFVITYTLEQLQESEEEGYTRGKIDGINEGHKEGYELNQKIRDALSNMVVKIEQLFHQHNELVNNSIKETSSLALQIAKKLAGNALQENPDQVIEGAIAQCFKFLFNEPNVDIVVHSSLAKSLEEKINKIVSESQFSGNIKITGDDAVAVGDCRIQWQGGGASCSLEERNQKIQDVIDSL